MAVDVLCKWMMGCENEDIYEEIWELERRQSDWGKGSFRPLDSVVRTSQAINNGQPSSHKCTTSTTDIGPDQNARFAVETFP
ncbi:predicted protein [Plenodomus lingam JN3]|uniref:Predicted protein n=1 Tax=Leptosphaeria maculans (strain JN3 / isolate v23.1.3 / race Av1-4-5-6-7-8) TaxID=985895 RepID=E5A594_LEPMJ|nr:predicted protein [Plenodomus lingam JN3]CBX98792.1 predicted protein [Plenodomus lingam JN3]